MHNNTYGTPDEYLQQHPKLKKWMVQCWQCQTQGYSPGMPWSQSNHREAMQNDEEVVNAEFMNIRARFKCLPLNADGLCDVCAEWL